MMFNSATRSRPAFLASVTSAAEAAVALENGAEIIDCKNPQTGALGALPLPVTGDVVAAVGGRVPVSATVGDLPAGDCAGLMRAAEMTAATGVDIVKIGFFGGTADADAAEALGRSNVGRARLVAVLMADRIGDFTLIPHLQRSGFIGVMLDTANKSTGPLTQMVETEWLAQFLREARGHGLMAGLAGSLRPCDVAGLSKLGPDILGFRGALCGAGRTGRIEARRVAEIASEIERARVSQRTRCVA